MKVFIGQIYTEAGVSFPFSYHLQNWLGERLSTSIKPSKKFIARFGTNSNLVFRMSAKANMVDTEIRGPTVYKKTTDVEYSIFLPYDVICKKIDGRSRFDDALRCFLGAVVEILGALEIETVVVKKSISSLVSEICSNPLMFNG